MTYEEIESFLAVVKYGTLAKAADSLYITQPTLSQRLSTLEKELGVVLLSRKKGNRHVELTPEGAAFLPQTHKWGQLWTQTMTAMSREQYQTTTIAASLSISTYLLRDVVRRFLLRKMPVKLQLRSLLFTEAQQAIRSGAVDFAFYSMQHPNPDIRLVPICREQLVFVCSNGSSYREKIDPSDLDPEKELYVGHTNRDGYSNEFTRWHHDSFHGKRAGLEVVNVPHLDRFFTLPDQWSILPYSVAEPYLCDKIVERRLLTDAPEYRTIYLLCRQSVWSSSPILQDFLEDFSLSVSEKAGIVPYGEKR